MRTIGICNKNLYITQNLSADRLHEVSTRYFMTIARVRVFLSSAGLKIKAAFH